MIIENAIKKLDACPNLKVDFSIYVFLMAIGAGAAFYIYTHKSSNFLLFNIVFFVVCLIIGFLMQCYTITTLRYYILGTSDFLPVWAKDFKTMIKIGFKYLLGLLVYFLGSILALKFIFMVIFRLFGSSVSASKSFITDIAIIIPAISIILLLIFLYYSVAILISYSIDTHIKSMFNFKQINKIVTAGKFDYFKTLFVVWILHISPYFVLPIILNIFMLFLFKYIKILIAVDCIIITLCFSYISILSMAIYGQFFREMLEAEKVKTV